MLSKLKAILKAEVTDAAVVRGILVGISMLALHFGLKYGVDKPKADVIASAFWSFLTILLSRAPGKGQS